MQVRSNPTRGIILALALALTLPAVTDARIQRSAAEVLAFKRHNPCPSTGQRRGACPGWQVDHTTAICAGGADRRENMQWLTIEEHRVKTRGDVRACRSPRN